MRTQRIFVGAATLALAVSPFLLAGCGPQRPGATPETADEVTQPAAQPTPQNGADRPFDLAADDAELKKHVEIDIGDVTYGVYTSIEILNKDVTPNLHIQRLSSPRFDHRTQYLTMNITPPYPKSLPMVIVLGSTRFMTGHTVYLKVHTYRKYTDESGKDVDEEILGFDRILGNQRLVRRPEVIGFDAFEGLDHIPSTMLLYCHLEAWLFLDTDPNTFDPKTADLSTSDPKHYKLYDGFNPARINVAGVESAE